MTNPSEIAIDTEDLSKSFGSRRAVGALSLQVHAGEIFGFLGPNGAGKTTTIRMLTGLLKPTSGQATVGGHSVEDEPIEVKRRIGYLADPPFLYEQLTGWEFLEFIAELYGVSFEDASQRAQRLLELLELHDRVGELVEGFSHGMRQKLALVGTLLHEPQVLFLDEPTAGLDPRSARAVKNLLVELARRGHTVFLSTHILEIAQYMCHRVGIINEGELNAVGSLDELREQARTGTASLEELFLQLTGGADVHEIADVLEPS